MIHVEKIEMTLSFAARPSVEITDYPNRDESSNAETPWFIRMMCKFGVIDVRDLASRISHGSCYDLGPFLHIPVRLMSSINWNVDISDRNHIIWATTMCSMDQTWSVIIYDGLPVQGRTDNDSVCKADTMSETQCTEWFNFNQLGVKAHMYNKFWKHIQIL